MNAKSIWSGFLENARRVAQATGTFEVLRGLRARTMALPAMVAKFRRRAVSGDEIPPHVL
jgi:hypothetical protein